MSELSEKLKKIKAGQVQVRYAAHYEQGNDFVIEGQHPTLVQIFVKPDDAVELLGDLLKYVFGNCKQRGEDD